MRILQLWQLTVSFPFFLTRLAYSKSELSDLLTVPTSSETPGDKTLPTKLSSIQQYESVCVNITKQEHLANIEAKLTKKMNAIKDETSQRMKSEFTLAVGTLSSIVVNYAEILQKSAADSKVAMENLKKELQETQRDFAATSQMLADKIEVTEEKLAVTLKCLETTKNELTQTKAAVEELSAKLNARTSEIVDIGQMPTSCEDLQRVGQKISGFYSVKGKKKMEIVYCNFNSGGSDKQKWIGYADVKSAPVHFYVKRNSSFVTIRTPIPFDLAVVNEGNAMNLTSGIFTAPLTGIYFFSFTGTGMFIPSSSPNRFQLGVALFLNGGTIMIGFIQEGNMTTAQLSPLTLQSTLNLKRDDNVWLQIYYISSGVSLYDDSAHYTHFTGFMLEEEITASL